MIISIVGNTGTSFSQMKGYIMLALLQVQVQHVTIDGTEGTINYIRATFAAGEYTKRFMPVYCCRIWNLWKLSAYVGNPFPGHDGMNE